MSAETTYRGAKNIWVKKNHHTRGERLKIATYNVRTLLKYENVQDRTQRSPKKRGKFHNFSKWSHALPL